MFVTNWCTAEIHSAVQDDNNVILFEVAMAREFFVIFLLGVL